MYFFSIEFEVDKVRTEYKFSELFLLISTEHVKEKAFNHSQPKGKRYKREKIERRKRLYHLCFILRK